MQRNCNAFLLLLFPLLTLAFFPSPVFAQSDSGMYIVSDMTVDGLSTITRDELIAFIGFGPGATVSAENLSSLQDKLKSWGYFDSVEVSFTEDDGHVSVTIGCRENPPVKGLAILVNGIDSPQYLNMLSLKTGKAFNHILSESDSRVLSTIPYAKTVNASIDKSDDGYFVQYSITMQDALSWRLSFYNFLALAATYEFSYPIPVNIGLSLLYPPVEIFSGKVALQPFLFFRIDPTLMVFYAHSFAITPVFDQSLTFGVYYSFDRDANGASIRLSALAGFTDDTISTPVLSIFTNMFFRITSGFFKGGLYAVCRYYFSDPVIQVINYSYSHDAIVFAGENEFSNPILTIFDETYLLRWSSSVESLTPKTRFVANLSADAIFFLLDIPFMRIGIILSADMLLTDSFTVYGGGGIYCEAGIRSLLTVPFAIEILSDITANFTGYAILFNILNTRFF